MTTYYAANQKDADRAVRRLEKTPPPFTLKVEKGKLRSTQQNRYLWGVCYPTILEQAGEDLAGWRNADLHEYFLGEHFGWNVIKGFGRKRMKPVHRSSTLTKQEFTDYVAFIQEKAAGMGIVIPGPESDDE